MNLSTLIKQASLEARVQAIPHTGVAARVLGDTKQYPPAHEMFMARIQKDAGNFIQLAQSPEGSKKISERLELLAQAYRDITENRSLQNLSTNKELQGLLAINVEGVQRVAGSHALSIEIDLIYREYAVLSFLNKFSTPQSITTETVATYGRSLDLFAYDIEFVTDDLLGVDQAVLADDENLKNSLPAIAPSLTQTQLIQRIQGDLPNPEIVEEDLASLVGAVLRPLHFLPEWERIKTLPGSIVWSTAALYELFRTSDARVELAPQLATMITEFYKLKRPYHPADSYIQELFIIGQRILAEWHQAHPPQQPIWETSPELAAAMKEQGESPPTVTPQTQPVPTQPAQPTQEATQQEPAPTQVPVSNGSAPQPPSQLQTETQPAQVPGTPTPQPTEQPAGTIDLREQPQEDQDRGESGEPQGKPIPPINLR